jgi:hypothetical protein
MSLLLSFLYSEKLRFGWTKSVGQAQLTDRYAGVGLLQYRHDLASMQITFYNFHLGLLPLDDLL